MNTRYTIKRVHIIIDLMMSNDTYEQPPAEEAAEDPRQTTLNGWVSTGPAAKRSSATHSVGEHGLTGQPPNNPDGRVPIMEGGRQSHCRNCGAPGRRCLEKLGGYCYDCVPNIHDPRRA